MNRNIILVIVSLIMLSGCEDFLYCPPTGTLSDATLTTDEGVEYLVSSAYAGLRGPVSAAEDCWIPNTNWTYGDVRSEIAYKGGSCISDGIAIHYLDISDGIFTTEGILDSKWFYTYCLISRCHNAIRSLKQLSKDEYSSRDVRLGEIKVIRVHHYFDMMRIFNYVPYFDETIEPDDHMKLNNWLFSGFCSYARYNQSFASYALAIFLLIRPISVCFSGNKSAASCNSLMSFSNN